VSAYFIPVVALILGVVVRNEHVAMLSLIGGAVSLAAAWVVRWASMRAAAAAAGPAPAAAAPAK
jgi:drug/metabolite transporter (DMT)-like permease